MNYNDMSDDEINMAVMVAINPGIVADIKRFKNQISAGRNINHSFFGSVTCQEPIITYPDYCNNPAHAWPIFNEARIEIKRDTCQAHVSSYLNPSVVISCYNCEREILRAAMICFLMTKESEKENDY